MQSASSRLPLRCPTPWQKNHSIDEIIGYVEQNKRIWENALNLGVRDGKIIDIVGKAWKVTARARDKVKFRRTSTR
jgi:hypothetical protein